MKAGRIRELIKDIPDDMDIYLYDNASDCTIGLTPMFKGKFRYIYYGKKLQPTYGDWEEKYGSESDSSCRHEFIVEKINPCYYVLGDDSGEG